MFKWLHLGKNIWRVTDVATKQYIEMEFKKSLTPRILYVVVHNRLYMERVFNQGQYIKD